MNDLIEINIDNLVAEYTSVTPSDDDYLFDLKTKLKSLNLPDLRLFIIWIEYNQNYGLVARYFNTTVYFIKKRIKTIKSIFL